MLLFYESPLRCPLAWGAKALLVLIASTLPAAAQSVCLPAPRLLTTTPMGGQVGKEVQVVITGELLQGAIELRFSHPEITATSKKNKDGKPEPNHFVVTISKDCPPGIYEARVWTPHGMSTPRIFSVGTLSELHQTKPSSTLDAATTLPMNSVCNCVVPVRGVNHFRFTGSKDQRYVIDCSASGIDSKLRPVVIVADALGRDLVAQRLGDRLEFTAPDDVDYVIKVHDLTFQGGVPFFCRLALQEVVGDDLPTAFPTTRSVRSSSWPPEGLPPESFDTEVEPNDGLHGPNRSASQNITLPCDLRGNFFGAADVDSFEFSAKKDEVWWVEVASQRLGVPTDPTVLIEQIDSGNAGENKEGEEKVEPVEIAFLADIVSPIKVSSNHYTYDGPPYDAGSSDVLGPFTVPQDGRYRLQLWDQFGGTRRDPRNVYRLIIRQAQPDFSVVGWAMHMELRNGDRNALSKPIALRPGWTMPIEIIAIRRDGFDGPIEVSMDDLPKGVTACGLTIPQGKSRGMLLVTASADAKTGWEKSRMIAQAEIGDKKATRPIHFASMAWPVKSAWNEIPAPRLLQEVIVSVSGAQTAPISVMPAEDKVWEATEGEKLTIKLQVECRSEFSGPKITLKTLGDGFEQNKPFDLLVKETTMEVQLDLATLKTPPGDYTIAFYGSGVVKYVAPTISPTAAKKPAAKKPAAIKPVDTAEIIVSQPIKIRVNPAK